MAPRIPLESSAPVVGFAWARVALVLAVIAASAFTGFPFEGELPLLLGALALPWALITVVLAYRRPSAAFGSVIPGVDLGILVLIEALVPATYGAIRIVALLFICVHAHMQGEWRGVAIGVVGAGALAVVAAVTPTPVTDRVLVFYEAAFVVAAVAGALLLGRLRSAESAGRLRARGVTRRTFGEEAEARRVLAESLHDGPVQELIGLDMMLSAAAEAASAGKSARVAEVLHEARQLTERNIEFLRDEIVALGPGAFSELSFEEAVRASLPGWRRRFGIEIRLEADRLEMSPAMSGELFRIAQEAVTNAGRHAQARRINVNLHGEDGTVELRVSDDGRGFRDIDPDAPPAPGHLGLAAMRERVGVLRGNLRIDSTPGGTRVIVRAPLQAGDRAS